MNHLAPRTAVITGAASGIGRGLSRACVRAGMRVALLDIQPVPLQALEHELIAAGATALSVVTDVSDADSVEAAARTVQQRFGHVHLLANNAGVAVHGRPVMEVPVADWQWALGVNVMGVVHGVRAFLPEMRDHGQGGHIVNTASIGGLQVRPGWNGGPYSATKYAVVALSESLRNELEGTNVGVSVLCPGPVRTNLANGSAARPQRFGANSAEPMPELLKAVLAGGVDPNDVGELVLRAVRDRQFFVFTHPEHRDWIAQRHEQLMKGFDWL